MFKDMPIASYSMYTLCLASYRKHFCGGGAGIVEREQR